MARRLGTVLGIALATAGWLACGGSGDGGADARDAVVADVPDMTDATPEATPDLPADDADAAAQDLPPEAPGDTGPVPYVSARKVEAKADLVGGDNAYGMVGRAYLLENDHVRFLVQDAGTSVHLYLYGGNLIDADARHDDGSFGNDQWRELFAIVGFRVCASQKVEIVKDGSDGTEAILRVSGPDANTNMIAMLDAMAQPLDVTLQNDYILAPGARYVTLRTTAINDSDYGLADQVAGDFLSLGGAQHAFTMENGFGDAAGDVIGIASEGRGASYGYTQRSGTMNLPLVDASGTVSLLHTDFAIPAHGQASFERFLVVGTGDIESVLSTMRELRGESVPRLAGVVRDEAGAPLAGARVTAVVVDGTDRRAANQAVTAADGTYSMGVPAGAYEIHATAPGRTTRTATVEVTAGGATSDFAFAAAGAITLSIDEIDGPDPATATTLGPIPAKASLICLDADGASDAAIEESDAGCVRGTGAGVSDTGRWCELGSYPMGSGQGTVCALLNSVRGTAATVPLKPGRYRVVVSRGPEWEQYVVDDLQVTAGQTATVAAKLYRSVDTSGYLAADFHQHTFGSLDSAMSPWDKTVANLDEGVEIAADTEHDMLKSYDAMIAGMDVGEWIHGLNGDEVSVNTVGHFNLFGWTGALVAEDGTAGDLYPYAGTKLFSGRTQPDLTEVVRGIPGVALWQMNHPRDVGSGYTSFIQFDPTDGTSHSTAEPLNWDYDMIEVKDYVGTPEQYLESNDANTRTLAKRGAGDIPTMRDWFGWTGAGHPIAATANSDSHFRNHKVGWGRNLVRVGDRTPGTVTTDDIAQAVKSQRVSVSFGPFVQTSVGGVERMGSDEAVVPEGDGTVTVRLKVQAPSWVDVNRLEVYANGRPLVLEEVDGRLVRKDGDTTGDALWTALPLPELPANGAVRADVDIVLKPAIDTFYVFLVRGGGSMSPVAGGSPLAYTNALYVDVGGDGFTGFLE